MGTCRTGRGAYVAAVSGIARFSEPREARENILLYTQKYDRIIDLLEEIVKKENKSPNHGLESTGAPPAAGTPETHP